MWHCACLVSLYRDGSMLDAAGFQRLVAANSHNLSALSLQAVPPGAAACNYLVQDEWPLLCRLCLSVDIDMWFLP